jgi:hypothetical protein
MREPDFYMTSGETYPWCDSARLRRCWRGQRLGGDLRDDYLVLEVDPPFSGRDHKMERDFNRLIVVPRHAGVSLFPPNDRFICVHAVEYLPDDAEIPTRIEGGFRSHAWLELWLPDEPVVRSYGRVDRVRFLGDQDGPAERNLKSSLATALRDTPGCRVYLARWRYDFGSHADTQTSLCARTGIVPVCESPRLLEIGDDRWLGLKIEGLRSYSIHRPNPAVGRLIVDAIMAIGSHPQACTIRDVIFLEEHQEQQLAGLCKPVVDTTVAAP